MEQKGQQEQKEEEAELRMRTIFDMFDKDNDGRVSIEEFTNIVRGLNLNPTDKEIRDQLDKMDIDKDGTVDFDELKQFFKVYTETKNDREEILRAFQLFDKNGDGYVDANELKAVLTRIGQSSSNEEIDDMIGCVDKDNDGRINYKEFTSFIMKQF